MLILDRFKAVPVIDFEDASAGKVYSRQLKVNNPSAHELNVQIEGIPYEKGISFQCEQK